LAYLGFDLVVDVKRSIEIRRSTSLAVFPNTSSLQVLPQTVVVLVFQHPCVSESCQHSIVVFEGEHQKKVHVPPLAMLQLQIDKPPPTLD
jgi:hypothetical protein